MDRSKWRKLIKDVHCPMIRMDVSVSSGTGLPG